MPIGITSPARNLFLLGSSGAQVVTNFFKQIDQASSGNFFHTPSEIRYVESDEKFILAGEADRVSPASEKYGWIEKRQESGTQDWETQVSSTTGDNTTLQALELDGSNLVAVGKTGGVPWIAKYTDGGVITWQSTTNSGDVEYTGVTVDSNSNYYACGSTPVSGEAQAFVEKFDSSGNPGWGKSAFMLGRDVVLNKISANSRGEVVAVGYLEDDSADKGYIVKIDTNTGNVLWDRTLELNIPAANIELTSVDVDNNDEIYVCGNIKYDVVGQTILPVDGFIAKYTAEGNLLWQSQSDYASGTSSAVYYEDITIDNTTKKPTTFGYVRYAVGDSGTLISRYDPDGDLSWRREIDEGNSFDPRHTSVDGDQSFIYLLFTDQADSETYVYGKVSATGNGLGDFEYNDGTGAPLLQYITSSGPNGSDIGEKIGRLSDGSVRNDTSDLMTYPFTANKLLFDDLATQVTNKKRQMDSADSFEYSGSPAIRPADFQELNLLGENNFVGPELITNGTFDTDTNGWSSGNGAILTVESNALKIANNGTQISGFATQAIATVPGEQYTVAFEVVDSTSSAAWLRVGNNFGWVDIVNQNNNVVGTYETTFTAEGTLTYITLMVTVGIATRYTIVDNISVKQYKWLDTSGKGNDGGVSGATHNAAGYWEFVSPDPYVSGVDIEIPNPIPADPQSPFTFEVWTWRDTSDKWQTIMSMTGSYTQLAFGSTNTIRFGRNGGNGGNNAESNFSTSTGTWYHIVGTYDGNQSGSNAYVNIYVNGVIQVSGTDMGVNGLNNGSTIRLGTYGIGSGGEWLDGRIGEVRIYPRALTAAQVFQNYNATKFKYTNEPPDIAPKIGPGIVYDSNLLLNYDFGNGATYESRPYPRLANTISSTEQKIVASDAAGGDRFSHLAVAAGSGKIVVGAYRDDDNGSASGSAYIYDLDGTNEVKITASDGAEADQFGMSVAVGNDKVVVGAPFDDDAGFSSGSAYIYDLDGTNEIKITASDAAASSEFGYSVAVGNNRIVVGSPNANAAYIFDLSGNELAKIVPFDAATGDDFGYSVAVGDNRIVVGSWQDDDNGSRSGSAYIFDLDGNLLKKITPSDNTTNDFFGHSVAVGDNKIVVGAYGDDDNGSNSGAAYIFDLNGKQLAKMTASDGVELDRFGYWVAVGSNRIVVGAFDHHVGSNADQGAVYIFDLDGKELTKITSSDGAAGDEFGHSVAVGSGYAVISAWADDDAGSLSGSAYIYSLENPLSTTVKNLSGSSYTGTITDATFNSAGYFEFDGDGTTTFDAIDIPAWTNKEVKTVELWFYNFNAIPNDESVIGGPTNNQMLVNWGSGPAGITLGAWSSAATNESIGVWSYTTSGRITYLDVAVASGIHHLVVTWNTTDSHYYIYLDNVRQTEIAGSGGHAQLLTYTDAMTIGGNTGSGSSPYYFNGNIYEFRIYDRELTSAEVSKNFNATRAKYGV